MREGWKREGFAIAFLLLLFLLYLSAITVASAVNAAVVSEVKGLGDYVPRNHSFTHGDTLKVYVEMQDVNHAGFVSADFFFIIEDPKGYVVAMDSLSVERTNYRAFNDYVEYTKEIQDWWLYGKYELGIYAYDRVDEAKTRESKQKIEIGSSSPEKLIEGGKFKLDGGVVTKSLTYSRKEKRSIIFFVHQEAIIEIEKPPEIITPPTQKPEEAKPKPVFTVIGVSIDKFKVVPGETVSIAVTVKNTGIGGTEKVTVVINGEKETEESVTLNHLESKTLIFHVKKDLPGTYKVTIPGTAIVKLFFVEESRGEGEGEGEEEGTWNSTATLSASKSKMSEGGESPGSGLPDHVFGFGIAFIAIALFMFVITLLCLRFRSKQLSFNRFSR